MNNDPNRLGYHTGDPIRVMEPGDLVVYTLNDTSTWETGVFLGTKTEIEDPGHFANSFDYVWCVKTNAVLRLTDASFAVIQSYEETL